MTRALRDVCLLVVFLSALQVCAVGNCPPQSGQIPTVEAGLFIGAVESEYGGGWNFDRGKIMTYSVSESINFTEGLTLILLGSAASASGKQLVVRVQDRRETWFELFTQYGQFGVRGCDLPETMFPNAYMYPRPERDRVDAYTLRATGNKLFLRAVNADGFHMSQDAEITVSLGQFAFEEFFTISFGSDSFLGVFAKIFMSSSYDGDFDVQALVHDMYNYTQPHHESREAWYTFDGHLDNHDDMDGYAAQSDANYDYVPGRLESLHAVRVGTTPLQITHPRDLTYAEEPWTISTWLRPRVPVRFPVTDPRPVYVHYERLNVGKLDLSSLHAKEIFDVAIMSETCTLINEPNMDRMNSDRGPQIVVVLVKASVCNKCLAGKIDENKVGAILLAGNCSLDDVHLDIPVARVRLDEEDNSFETLYGRHESFLDVLESKLRKVYQNTTNLPHKTRWYESRPVGFYMSTKESAGFATIGACDACDGRRQYNQSTESAPRTIAYFAPIDLHVSATNNHLLFVLAGETFQVPYLVNEWVNLAVTYDSSRRVTVFVNGESVQTIDGVDINQYTSQDRMDVNLSNADIDDMRIYRQALQEDDIRRMPVRCPPGEQGFGGSDCVPCSRGTYKTVAGSERCTACTINETTIEEGAQSSDRCVCKAGYWLASSACGLVPSGSYRSDAMPTYESCPANSRSSAGAKSIRDCLCDHGFESSSNGQTCTECPEGKFNSARGQQCIECRRFDDSTNNCVPDHTQGTLVCDGLCESVTGFQVNRAGNGLEPCPLGTYNDATNVNCTPCALGHTTTKRGSVSGHDCTCDVGYTFYGLPLSSQMCMPCPPQTFKNAKGVQACTACDDTETSGVGQTRCQCVTAQYRNTTTNTCEACPVDTYKDVAGDHLCTRCAENATTNGTDAQEACFCMPGYYSTDEGLCVACSVGSYKGNVGNYSCLECTHPQHTTLQIGSTSIQECVCNAGYTGPDGGTCKECGAGKYKSTIGPLECSTCANFSNADIGSTSVQDCQCNAGYFGPDGGTCAACEPGKYKETIGPDTCISCGTGETSLEASTSQSACVCDLGFYKGTQNTYEVTNEFACTLDNDLMYGCSTSTAINNCNQDVNCHAFYCPVGGSYMLRCQRLDIPGTGGYPAREMYVKIPPGCESCQAGTYKSNMGSQSCTQCPDFTTSPIESNASSQCTCNLGHTGPDGGPCAACNVETYKSTSGSNNCSTCPQFSISDPGSVSQQDCRCNAGYYGPDGGECEACPAGTYKDTTGSSDCTACAADKTSTAASTSEDACVCHRGYDSGTPYKLVTYRSCGSNYAQIFNIETNSNIENCDMDLLSSAKQACNTYESTCLGVHCDKNLISWVMCITSVTSSNAWSSDEVYVKQSPQCIPCAAGTYKDAPSTQPCTECPDSSTSPEASTNVQNCTCNAGFTGDDGAACTACEAGKYKAESGSAACTNCDAGKYSSKTNSTTASDCISCLQGSNSDAGSTTETDCLCDAGTYYPATKFAEAERTKTNVCPDNAYVSFAPWNLDDAKSLCDSEPSCTGFWHVIWNFGDFKNCDSNYAELTKGNGQWCREPMTETDPPNYPCNLVYRKITQCQDCPTGSSSSRGAVGPGNCTCNAGYTGNDGGTCTACVAGKYKGNEGSNECSDCEAGKYSTDPAANSSTVCIDCVAGKYSMDSTVCTDCPADSTSPSRSDAIEDCTCNAGYTGNDGGTCTACDAGKYKINAGSSICTACPPLSTSPSGSTLESACICNAGSTEDSGSCVQCEAGKYKTSPGSDQCTDCDAGKYSSTVGATTYTVCQDCPEYTYRIQTGASAVGDCQSCPTHSSAPPGSDALENCMCDVGHTGSNGGPCTACEAGKYKSTTGSDDCIDCPSGSYSSDSAATSPDDCLLCAVGNYTVNNLPCVDCPKFSTTLQPGTSISDCICNAGYYGPSADNCLACWKGKYKPDAGSAPCTDCGPGKYSESVGETSESVCLECDAGKYADTVGSSHATMCTTCPPDSTSPQGSPRRTACKCSAGFTGADGFPCTACEAGKYKAESGSAACTDCSAGKYSSNVALATEAECVACAAETVSPAGSDSASDCVEPGPCVIEGKNPSTGYVSSVKEHQDGWLTNPQEDFHCPQSRHTGFMWYNFPSYTQLFCLYGQYSLVSDANAVTTYYDSTWCG